MKPEQYPAEPAHLWEHFYQITQIPRPSKEEAAVRQYVIDQAEAAGCEWATDDEGNLVVRVPGSTGREQESPVIIQNHLDMVTVKTEDKAHDFSADPLSLQVKEGWLCADRTTLGADNGVGCAAALAAMTDGSVSHPPLELLFTVDEETGLGGALNLDAGLLSGGRMLNLDTEDWNELYVGCAGGGGWQFTREFDTVAEGNEAFWEISLKGLAGGHSGIQIHEQLGNAIKLLGQLLYSVSGARLISMSGGVAHNVIPREGSVVLAVPADAEDQLRTQIDKLRTQWLGFLPPADAELELTMAPAAGGSGLSRSDTLSVLGLIAAFPHGVQAYNLAQPADLPDLSINLAVCTVEDGKLFLEASFRFFNYEQSLPLQQAVESLAAAFELHIEPQAGYPGWQPDFNSALLEQGAKVHERLFGFRPEVKAIHAGLECGILKSKKPDCDILSFGPTIRGAHSPTERLEIGTVAPFWDYLKAMLADM